MDPLYTSSFISNRHERVDAILRNSSVRTETTSLARQVVASIQSSLPKVSIAPDIESFEPRSPEVSVIDQLAARDVLVRKKRNNPNFKDPSAGIFKTKKAKQRASDLDTWQFDEHEKSLALREAVEESGNIGVAQQLIEMGADVNFFHQPSTSRRRSLRSSRANLHPINYTKIAAMRNNPDMVSLFASHGASPSNLVEALEQAVERNSTSVVKVLLQHGVDPNAREGSIFASAVTTQNPALLILLLSSRNKISIDLLTRHLPIAVSQGKIEIVSLLVAYGADTTAENASALRKAVQAQRIELVLAIIKGGVNGDMATSVIGEAFPSRSSLSVPKLYALVEILLCAGAKGDPVTQLLVPIVRAGHRTIVQLLVLHGADLQYNSAEALKIAVTSKRVDILSKLLLGSVPKAVVSVVIDNVPHSCSDDESFEIISRLITKGATGKSLHRALVRAVQQKSNRTIGLLLDHNASVDFEQSQALRIAVTEGNLGIVNLLLSKGRPHPNTMQLVLPLVPPFPLQARYDMTKSILSTAGHNAISSSILNDALLESLKPSSGNVDQSLVDLLITAGAQVDCQRGKCFRLAAETGSIEVLELLIPHLIDPSSLSAGISVSMRLKEPTCRRRFFAILLENGAIGPEVDQAFVDAIEEKPSDEVLVQLLLEKANFQYQGGRALSVAVQYSPSKLVASIIDTHRTDQESRLAAGLVLSKSSTPDRQAKLRLLLEEGIGQTGLNDTLIREIRGERNAIIVKMLIDYKASCEHDHGKAIKLAIRSQDYKILQQLVDSRPNHRILQDMIPVAMSIKSAASRRTCVASLLQGGARGTTLSEALAQETQSLDHRDHAIVQQLVQNGARIDHSQGRAIKQVVSQHVDLDLLKILVSGTAASTVLPELVTLAMAREQDVRLKLLQVILENGARGDSVHAALVTAVSEGTKARPTIDLLLEYQASVNFKEAAAVKVAAWAGDHSILDCLLSKGPNPDYISDAVDLAMQSRTAQSKSQTLGRLHSVKMLTRTKVAKPEALHSALLRAVQEKDYDLIDHLIIKGGDPNYEGGRSVVTATKQGDVRSLSMLVRAKPTHEVFSRAFAVMPLGLDRWDQKPDLINEFDTIMISGGATGPAVDQAFLSALQTLHNLAPNFVHMILSYKIALNANFQDGESLCTAVRTAQFEIVDYLLSCEPNKSILRSAFMAIFQSKGGERVLITLAQRFFAHSNNAQHIYFRQNSPANDALYQTLLCHSDKADLLQLLLDNGCDTDSRILWVFDQTIGSESISPLLWLLSQSTESINGRTVKLLLDQGADPNFRAPRSGNTPLIKAAASAPPEIVQHLLSRGAEPDSQDHFGRSPLQYATMASNLESMGHILRAEADTSDESLHVAARQLDVPAATILIDHGASTSLPGTSHCDGRMPLGELCRKANLQQNPPQLKRALRMFLKATTDLKVPTNGRSLIFHALDNDSPLKMTTALLKACPEIQQNLNEDFNIYSADAFRYSPTAYVRQFKCIEPTPPHALDFSYRCCRSDDCLAAALEKLLHAHGCNDRFWDNSAGANQPSGCCSPPAAIVAAQKEADSRRRELAEQARIQREEKARLDKIQANLDAAAAADRKRERERLRVLEEERIAEERAEERRVELAVREKRRLAAIAAEAETARSQREQMEFNAARDREQRKFSDQQRRAREDEQRKLADQQRRAREEERTIAERAKIRVMQTQEETRAQKSLLDKEREVVRGRREMFDSAAGMMRQVEFSGMQGQPVGRILKELN